MIAPAGYLAGPADQPSYFCADTWRWSQRVCACSGQGTFTGTGRLPDSDPLGEGGQDSAQIAGGELCLLCGVNHLGAASDTPPRIPACTALLIARRRAFGGCASLMTFRLSLFGPADFRLLLLDPLDLLEQLLLAAGRQHAQRLVSYML